MFPPNKILIVSDDNELELKDIGKSVSKGGDRLFVYVYTKSNTKLNTKFRLTESELIKYIENRIFKEI